MLTNILIALGILLPITFLIILILGPCTKISLIKKAHHFFTETLPLRIQRFFIFLLGPYITNSIISTYHYITEEKNPLVQIFYLSLLIGGFVIYLFIIWPKLDEASLSIHKLFSPIFTILVLYSFIKVSVSDPGIINSTNLTRATEMFPYDYVIFHPKECRTCQFIKPPRSKHCSLCKACIARSDHHCPWINNCVGHLNQRWFFLFLFSTFGICMYGSYISYQIMAFTYTQSNYSSTFSLYQKFMISSRIEPLIFAFLLFVFLAGIVVFLFSIYELQIVMKGTTTNEISKWEDVEYAIKTGNLNEWHRDLYNYNHSFGSQSKPNLDPPLIRSESHYESGKDDMVKLDSIKQMKNIYDLGWRANLRLCFLPKALD